MSKTRTYSRRGRALRRLALLLVLLAASAALRIGIGSYCVTPEQALRRMESQNGVSGLEIIRTTDSVGNPGGEKRILICHTEGYIALNLVKFTPMSGWGSRAFYVLDTDNTDNPKDRNLLYMCEEMDTGEAWFCLFGFVPEGEEPPTFRVGIYNEDARKEDGSDQLLNTVTYTPTPTIRVEGGMLFFEQHTYSAPKAETPEEQREINISHDGLHDGVWEKEYWWSESNI